MELSPSGVNAGPHRPRRYAKPSDDSADGTVAEVLDRVGDDLDVAARALEAEQAKDHPRVTLLDALEGLLTEPDPDASDDADAEPEEQSSSEV